MQQDTYNNNKPFCTKCNNGTIITTDPVTGEEYSDYCECRIKIDTDTQLISVLQKAKIPKDYWYLEFDNYINPVRTIAYTIFIIAILYMFIYIFVNFIYLYLEDFLKVL